MKAPMQLRKFNLIHLLVDTNNKYKPNCIKDVPYKMEVDFNVYQSENGLIFKVPLEVIIKPEKRKKNFPLKKLEIKIEGIFEFEEGTPEKLIKQMIPLNCISILYGIQRGIISNVTGNIPGESFILPTINFLEIVKNKVEEIKEKRRSKNIAN